MEVQWDEAVSPIAPIGNDHAGMQSFSSKSFGTPGFLEGQRVRERESGNQDSPEESPSQTGTKNAELALVAHQARLVFEKHETSGKMVARLKDPDTGEVIRQIPPEEMLKLAEAIDRYLGLFVDKHS